MAQNNFQHLNFHGSLTSNVPVNSNQRIFYSWLINFLMCTLLYIVADVEDRWSSTTWRVWEVGQGTWGCAFIYHLTFLASIQWNICLFYHWHAISLGKLVCMIYNCANLLVLTQRCQPEKNKNPENTNFASSQPQTTLYT